MKKITFGSALLLLVLSSACMARQQAPAATPQQQAASKEEAPDPVNALPWRIGPVEANIGDRATLSVPEGYAFLDAEATKKFNALMENPPSGTDEYTLAPLDLHWTAYFSFNPIGFVKDDESIDADAILQTVRDGTEASNAERRKNGWSELHVTGWSFKPQYDKQLKTLEWAILAENDAHAKIVNYNTRLLGRRGVMEVTVVALPEQLTASIGDFKKLMPGYDFAAGEKYAEFREGDHVAEIGLAALITGGAAAVAAKKGFFAALAVALLKAWKLVLIGLAAVGTWGRKLFRRRAEATAPVAAAPAGSGEPPADA
jgi:uncharacterized membrane-anchored protein